MHHSIAITSLLGLILIIIVDLVIGDDDKGLVMA
jgi:hypothetical protein